jgi:hypothetical protein
MPRNRLSALAAATLALWGAVLILAAGPARAFCGFYVGKADASLFNKASQVILVRDGNRTVISMLSDYHGSLDEFALVVPVPQVLKEGQIHVGERKIFDRIDSYSAPRLAEYYDADPCVRELYAPASVGIAARSAVQKESKDERSRALGVAVEASYTVGEYDIVILSARESDGLETWLLENGYRIPKGASKALKPYIRQDMKFFVAKVNIKEQARTGLTYLRPLQFAYESEKFMLPLRLGMVNADGPQDLIAYVLTRHGRVEATNYRTVKLPANMDLPVYIRSDFASFYRSLFERQAKAQDQRVVFTEYFWDMGWCDPCAADPLSPDELRAAGVFWFDDEDQVDIGTMPRTAPGARWKRQVAGTPVMVTRLHVRYTPQTFPEDLMFQETGDRENFQARYVLRHPWRGRPDACPEAKLYFDALVRRQEKEAQTLSSLTGWDIKDVRARMDLKAVAQRQWWERLWR